MKRQTIQETGLWEAWIEFDEFDTKKFGTLYIIGEINTIEKNARFIKLPCECNENTLRLMVPAQLMDNYKPLKEVLYSEPVESIGKYDTVRIYAGNELVASFDEIEIMI